MKKITVLINKNSGTTLRLGQEKIESDLRARLGDRIDQFLFVDGSNIVQTLEDLARNPGNEILVGGGDGTAVTAADILGKHKIPFGILPLGTMNLLAQDLGSAPTFEQTIQSLNNLVEDTIDAGVVNNKLFLCSAVVGFVPEGAVAREALRENVTIETMANFIGTIAHGIAGNIKHMLNLKSRKDDKPYPIETTALIVSNNSFVKKPSHGGERFLRETLTDGKLAVYSAAPQSMMDGLRMALSLWHGDWQEHESIRSFEAPELIVETEQDKVLVSLDGEPVELQSPLYFSIKPKSVPVLRMELAA